jgi:hypothetical protein
MPADSPNKKRASMKTRAERKGRVELGLELKA